MAIFEILERQSIEILEKLKKRKYTGFFDYEIKDIPQIVLNPYIRTGIIEIKESTKTVTVYKINKTKYEERLNNINYSRNKGEICV